MSINVQLPWNSTGWRYLAALQTDMCATDGIEEFGGVYGDTSWAQPGYDDSAWAVGQAPFGWGFGGTSFTPRNTTLAQKNEIWMRHLLPGGLITWSVQMKIDNYCFVYFNGNLVRGPMPSGAWTGADNGLALQIVGDIPRQWVRPDFNVIAMHVQDQLTGYGGGDIVIADAYVYVQTYPLLGGLHGPMQATFDEEFTDAVPIGSATLSTGSPTTHHWCEDAGWTGTDMVLVDGSASIGWKVDGNWTYAEPPPDVYRIGIADAYSVQTTVSSEVLPSFVARWLAAVNQDFDVTGAFIDADGLTDTAHVRLYRRGVVVDEVLLTRAPVAGDVVKLVTDFQAMTIVASYNGSVVGTIDFSAETWFTQDGSLI